MRARGFGMREEEYLVVGYVDCYRDHRKSAVQS